MLFRSEFAPNLGDHLGDLDHCLVSLPFLGNHFLTGALGYRSEKELLGVLEPDASDEEARYKIILCGIILQG